MNRQAMPWPLLLSFFFAGTAVAQEPLPGAPEPEARYVREMHVGVSQGGRLNLTDGPDLDLGTGIELGARIAREKDDPLARWRFIPFVTIAGGITNLDGGLSGDVELLRAGVGTRLEFPNQSRVTPFVEVELGALHAHLDAFSAASGPILQSDAGFYHRAEGGLRFAVSDDFAISLSVESFNEQGLHFRDPFSPLADRR